jgi:tetratricopeptide (TPR) repeat protein
MSKPQVFLLRDDLSLQALLDGAQREGFSLLRRVPRRGESSPFWEWATGRRDEDRATLVDHVLFGVRYVFWSGDEAPPAWLLSHARRFSVEEAEASAKEARSPEAKIATLCEAVACFAPALPESLCDVVVARLRDGDAAVRWMANVSLRALADVTLDKVLTDLLAGEVPQDLEARARELSGLVKASIRGEWIDDLVAAKEDYLQSALQAALVEKKWRRVEVAAARLVWKEKPFFDRPAAAAWAAAMAATDRLWRAWTAALVFSEIDRAEGQEGMAAAVRAEVEPKLEGRADAPAPEDLHPVLWLLHEASGHRDEGWLDALGRVLDALDARVTGYPAERLLMRVIHVTRSGEGKYADARPVAKQLAALRPGAVTPWALLAYLRPWEDTGDEALLDYDKLAEAIERKEARSPEDAAFDAWAEGILAYQARKPQDLLRGHIHVLQKRGDEEGALRAAERVLRFDDSALAWLDKGMMLTSLRRHHDAIEAYSQAIARVGKDGMVLLGGSYDAAWFNRACERAITGDVEGALRDLAEAIRKDEKWIESARTDDYFNAIRSDERFERLLRGDLAAAPPEEPAEDWQRLASRCKGLAFGAHYEQAIEAGRAALRKAEKELGPDAPGVAECLENLGFALTWSNAAEEGVTVLRRAVAIRAQKDPTSREMAEALHHLGSALLHTGALDEADRRYAEALALREQHDGADSPIAAKSWGDMAGVSFQAGRRDEGIERLHRARTILEGVLARFEAEGRDPEDDTLVEARIDLLTVGSNLLLTHARASENELALSGARVAVEQAKHLRQRVNQRLRSSIAHCLQHLAEQGAEGALDILAALADAVLPKEPVEVREARVRWAQIRGAVQSMRSAGLEDAAILDLLKGALRGDPPPPRVARIEGAAAGLSAFVHDVSVARGGNVVVTIMALETAAAGGSTLDATLGELEDLAVASVAAAAEEAGGDQASGEGGEADPKDEGPPAWERDPFGNPYVASEYDRRIGYDPDAEGDDPDDEDEEDWEEEDDEEG